MKEWLGKVESVLYRLYGFLQCLNNMIWVTFPNCTRHQSLQVWETLVKIEEEKKYICKISNNIYFYNTVFV